ncbi:hypothetical protein B0A48_10277 [Cryoendolithus antarcticus]|uniref:Uncharacterized protein n=1 Tax=Cryoendolithus antarcticus TaxID=1507870 RepID=A0A1V8SXI1_9PEZI|nr:hypothetical protein B0A48_10277 [Cryoendolithus antarcticus]
MPVVWNAETEAKLLGALFKVTDLKVTQAQMQEIAGIVSPGNSLTPFAIAVVLLWVMHADFGPDCTAKAISHRIAKFRSSGKKESSETPAGTPKTPKKGTAAKGKGSTGKKRERKVAEEDEGEGEDDDEDVGGGKRAKIGEEDEGEEGVKVKGEEGEDEV